MTRSWHNSLQLLSFSQFNLMMGYYLLVGWPKCISDGKCFLESQFLWLEMNCVIVILPNVDSRWLSVVWSSLVIRWHWLSHVAALVFGLIGMPPALAVTVLNVQCGTLIISFGGVGMFSYASGSVTELFCDRSPELWQCDSQTKMISRSMTKPFVCVNTTHIMSTTVLRWHHHHHRGTVIIPALLNPFKSRTWTVVRRCQIDLVWLQFYRISFRSGCSGCHQPQTNSSLQHQETGIELSWELRIIMLWETDSVSGSSG